MSEHSLSSDPNRPEESHRPSKTAWVFRQPPGNPIERVDFYLLRMQHVLLYSVWRDLADLRGALAEPVTPATRRRWATQYWVVEREVRSVLAEIRKHRVRLGPQRVQRMEDPDRAWLRRQLRGLEPPQ